MKKTYSILLFICTLTLSSCNNQSGINFACNKSSGNECIGLSIISPPGVEQEEWTLVPANAGNMNLPAFYVMKYEAKAKLDTDGSFVASGYAATATHSPGSHAEDTPWRNLNATDASAECSSLGEGFDLISNEEWIAIARDIEAQDANWTNGMVGDGCLFTGNGNHVNCGYIAASSPDSGELRNTRAKHVLSNGSELYDFAGNMWEWADFDKDTPGFQIRSNSCSTSRTDLPLVSCPEIANDDFNTSNGSYTTVQGAGRFWGGVPGAAIRGGAYIENAETTGIFTINLRYAPTLTNAAIGFRCVYRI